MHTVPGRQVYVRLIIPPRVQVPVPRLHEDKFYFLPTPVSPPPVPLIEGEKGGGIPSFLILYSLWLRVFV